MAFGSILGGGIGGIGEAASKVVRSIRKRGDQQSADAGEVQKTNAILRLFEGVGTLRQRNARPDFLYTLGFILRVYMLMPIAAEAFNILTVRARTCSSKAVEEGTCVIYLQKFDWQVIWQTTGLSFMALAGTVVTVYFGGRTWEKGQDAASPKAAIFGAASSTLRDLGDGFLGRRRPPRTSNRTGRVERMPGVVVPDADRGRELREQHGFGRHPHAAPEARERTYLGPDGRPMLKRPWKYSRRSLGQLALANDRLQRLAHFALPYMPHDIGILETLRSGERQDMLFEKGASKTRDGRHEDHDGDGRADALDFGVYMNSRYVNGDTDDEIVLYRECAEVWRWAGQVLGGYDDLVLGTDWGWDHGHIETSREPVAVAA